MSEQEGKSFELDGTRPIESGEIEVVDTYEEDGTRPIAKGRDFLLGDEGGEENVDKSPDTKNQKDKTDKVSAGSNAEEVVDTFKEDGTRPIKSGEIEVADTFEEDGTRPIAESPDFLKNNQNEPAKSSQASSSSGKEVAKTKGKNLIGNGSREVVDTFEADGTRPIMSNKYDVVDTLDVDGERPITDESNINSQQS